MSTCTAGQWFEDVDCDRPVTTSALVAVGVGEQAHTNLWALCDHHVVNLVRAVAKTHRLTGDTPTSLTIAWTP